MARWLQGENAQMRSQDWFLATCGGEAGGGGWLQGVLGLLTISRIDCVDTLRLV